VRIERGRVSAEAEPPAALFFAAVATNHTYGGILDVERIVSNRSNRGTGRCSVGFDGRDSERANVCEPQVRLHNRIA